MNTLLSVGSRGPDVAAAQEGLNNAGHSLHPPLKTDGIFGGKTRARTQEFQRSNSLVADGVIGPMTLNILQQFMDLVGLAKPLGTGAEAAARQRVVDMARKYHLNHGWRATDKLGADHLRIAANLCFDQQTRARQGGVPLAGIWQLAAPPKPPAMACVTISKTAERNYAQGAPGRNNWDLPSWCGIFALAVYKSAGLKLSSWPLRIKGLSKHPAEFRPVMKKADLKVGDLGIFDFAPNHVNHHFLVVKIDGDNITSIDGNITDTIGGTKVQTIAQRNRFTVSGIFNHKFSAFVSPIWGSVL